MVTASGDRQAALERRYREASARPLDRQRSPRELFGEFEEWLLRLGRYELLLNPIDGVWYYYDRASDSTRSAGHQAGEVVFYLDGDQPAAHPAPQPPADESGAWRLVATEGGAEHALGATTTIGRAEDNAIVLDDDQVSRRHAVVHRQGNHYIVEDLGSRNGTSVNGNRIAAPTLLHPGDTLCVGRTGMLVRSE